MDVWSTHKSRQFGQTFWFNERTGISTWNDPRLKHRVVYSSKPAREMGAEEHKDSIGLRRFHNWIKAVAIARACKHASASGSASRVLDLACGRGGDLLKIAALGVTEYIGIDHSESALSEARTRAAALSSHDAPPAFFCGDIRCPLASTIAPRESFDVVMCMFGPHFAYSARNHAICFWENVRRSLRPGGTFVCIFPSRTAIEKLLNGQSCVAKALFTVSRAGRDQVVFHVHGSTPREPEPMAAPGEVCKDMLDAGLHVQFQGTPRTLRARRDGNAPSRAAMRCPERLNTAQWDLADLQCVIIASASDKPSKSSAS